MATETPEQFRTSSFADAALDATEREQLAALRSATTENSPLHLAMLATLSEAARAYRLQQRTSEIRRRLTDGGFPDLDDSTLRTCLDQLREWRCVDWVQDPHVRAATIDEYLKRHELWEITPIGEATLSAATSLLRVGEESGALQRTMFRQVHNTLDDLTGAISAADAPGVYLHLRTLDLALGQLASNAKEFYATINRIAREERLDDHVFLVYKDQLISYLQNFHDDLVRNRTLIADQFAMLDAKHRSNLLDLAGEGDDSGGLFSGGADWEQRWDGMLDWFVRGRTGRTEVDALSGATTVAIRELLTLLRRLTEQATRPVNRASELRETAAWFVRCSTDEDAHTLFDAAFGLTPVNHVCHAVADTESEGRFPSWWDVTPVDVHLSVRASGQRPVRRAPGKRRDYSAAKALLAHQREAEIERASATASQLVATDLTNRRISPEEWSTLLRWLDQVLAARPEGAVFSATAPVDGAIICLSSADHDTQLLGPQGTVILRRCTVELIAA